ncbi:DUF2278 family protein [Silvimonas amylolytica]|uniref:DUF2278 domain-containing protein n=1 Tax=Silvimonas amylolytica TaxID=449663 RepID=A0ABQ2PHI3_9NEIS|nr:DUF2278 family protein [Silvimonas amylolytica]GGP25077.1 hypothetical protein GCM10010971_08960 [Silvimonas amylolytica]
MSNGHGKPRLEYCMIKGWLIQAAPYFTRYNANPHYIITVDNGGKQFNIVVNSASQVPAGDNHDTRVLSYIDLHFSDPVVDKLKALQPGLYTDGFPRLDYWQDKSLLDISRFRPVPYEDNDGNHFDINDQIDQLLSIDEKNTASFPYPFNNGHTTQERDFWKPTDASVMVYGFGFLFQPAEDGLHETHMNQGNPRDGGHAGENGAFQDGAVIVQRGDGFTAIFTAFQSQYLPTLANGDPADNARPIDTFLSSQQ